MMKQKLFSLGDDFFIKDESGRDKFFVNSKLLSFGNQLSFKDLTGNKLVFIKQKLLSWGPTYEIYRGDQLYATVRKDLFTLFNCRFTVDVAGPNDLEAKGDFLDCEYEFNRDGRLVAAVSKKWFSWSDTYGVDISAGEDDILILASTVVIDMACHTDEN